MSDGKFHDKVTIYSALPVSFCFANFSGNLINTLIFTIGYLFAGFMFGPDLDVKSRQYRRWGLLRFIWIPYQKLGGHRSFASQSHDSLIGPFIRFVYLLLLLSLSIILLGFILQDNLLLKVSNQIDAKFLKMSFLFLSGSWFGSLSHHLTDWADAIFKLIKRGKKR